MDACLDIYEKIFETKLYAQAHNFTLDHQAANALACSQFRYTSVSLYICVDAFLSFDVACDGPHCSLSWWRRAPVGGSDKVSTASFRYGSLYMYQTTVLKWYENDGTRMDMIGSNVNDSETDKTLLYTSGW